MLNGWKNRRENIIEMKIPNYGSKLENKILLRLNNEEKNFISEMSKQYNIKETQYLRIIIDWFMTHIDEFEPKIK